ncbi:hypothetical protein QVD17_38880 [Tagetes erecta]|uniref:Uncharacterized protein n=1 Tax=Tagetes erecta TaxID=13708 RepID=A0AAD8NGL2_TARER|nr:hypothetical protein QVD17_38880 [Tagetes erecta]
MKVERDSVKLSLTNELINDACIHSMNANNHNQDYVVTTSSSMDVLIIAFKRSMAVNDLYDDDHFGEINVESYMFPSLQRIGEGQLAKVNRPILYKFMNLLITSGFKTEMKKAVKESKKILFTGHSSGGAIASLATLWMLDEYTRKQNIRLPIGCVTFGSPLIGDGTLTHAVRREKWAGHFTHFVMEHDVVPRMMLAPKTSIQDHLPNILEFFQQRVDPDDVDPDQAREFFENVLINASTVASHDAFDLMEPTNSLKERLSTDFIKVSPYRPFGIYVFCTRAEDLGANAPRQQLVVENPNAITQLLFYFLQLPNEDQDLDQFALQSLTENFSYEQELNNNGLRLENLVYLKNLNKELWTSNGTSSEAVRTSNQALFELNASAKWCLLAAEEAEKRKKDNENHIKESMRKYKSNQTKNKAKIIEDLLDEVRNYKQKHGDGENDYYEAFKLQNEYNDFQANVNRLEQAKIWDVIIEMVMRKDLPDEFEVWDELVVLGTCFRRLYEPLDIANYYRHAKGEGYLSYLGVRPKRYKFTQRWYEHMNVTGFELVSESNFVAQVEDLITTVEKPQAEDETIEQVKYDLESIANKVNEWKCDEKIGNEDVFWGDAILSKLKKKLP